MVSHYVFCPRNGFTGDVNVSSCYITFLSINFARTPALFIVVLAQAFFSIMTSLIHLNCLVLAMASMCSHFVNQVRSIHLIEIETANKSYATVHGDTNVDTSRIVTLEC